MGARLGGDEFALTLLEDEPTEVIREVEHIRGLFGQEAGGATFSIARAPAAPSAGSITSFRIFRPLLGSPVFRGNGRVRYERSS